MTPCKAGVRQGRVVGRWCNRPGPASVLPPTAGQRWSHKTTQEQQPPQFTGRGLLNSLIMELSQLTLLSISILLYR